MDKVHEIEFLQESLNDRIHLCHCRIPLGDIVLPSHPSLSLSDRVGKSLLFSFFSPSHSRQEIPTMVRRTASKNAFKNSEERLGWKQERGKIGMDAYVARCIITAKCIATAGVPPGFNRVGPVATPCRYSLRHSDRMQERASSRVLVVIIALKSLSHRRLTPLWNKNFLSGSDRSW